MKFKHTPEIIRIPDHKHNGGLIRTKRIAAKISLRGLAAVMGHSPSYQSDMELGKRALSKARFMQMVAFLEAKQ